MLRNLTLLLLLAATPALSAPDIRLTAVPPTQQVRQTGEVVGRSRVEVSLAKGEVESFQVVVTAMGGTLREVDAAVGEVRDASGNLFPAENLVWYREAFVPVRHPSPRAELAPGLVPDPLVPFLNPYTQDPVRQPRWSGEAVEGGFFGGTHFDLWEGNHQPLWLDIRAARDLPAGVYRGTISVRAREVEPVEMPIAIEVWDFALPPGPTHENHFGGVERIAAYYTPPQSATHQEVLEDLYNALLADHRLNPSVPRKLLPKPDEDGTVTVSDEDDRRITEFIEKYRVTDFEYPRTPYGDPFGADREKVLRFYRSWYDYLKHKGWAERAYLYMQDEPNDATAYQQVKDMGALIAEAHPAIRKLVVEQTYTQTPEWPDIEPAVDIWCPLFAFIEEDSIRAAHARGDEVWSYTALTQTAPPYHPDATGVRGDLPPFWEIDFPGIHYRIAPWLNRRYGITGLLYWSVVYWGSPDRDPWQDPGFRVRWNGEGALIYPGDDAGIAGPVASIRLKHLRDGMEDYEYFALLASLGGEESVNQAVRVAVPTWGSFTRDTEVLKALRRTLAKEILAASRGSAPE